MLKNESDAANNTDKWKITVILNTCSQFDFFK